MASNQSVTPVTAPLSMFQSLSPGTFLYEPPSDAPAASDPKAPKLIMMFAWFAAQDAHIAKYTTQHIALYPTARILLIKCPFRHMLPGTSSELLPAIDVLKTLPTDAKGPQLLIHSFSNGGSFNLVRVSKLWQEHAPALPPHVLIIDSAPDKFSLARTLKTFTASAPGWVRPPMYVFLAFHFMVLALLRVPTFHDNIRNGLNDSVVLASEARRTYVYSKGDEMVAWEDVLTHADGVAHKAGKLGTGLEVRTEEFVGSGHVAHARLDGERYWGIARETWEGRAG